MSHCLPYIFTHCFLKKTGFSLSTSRCVHQECGTLWSFPLLMQVKILDTSCVSRQSRLWVCAKPPEVLEVLPSYVIVCTNENKHKDQAGQSRRIIYRCIDKRTKVKVSLQRFSSRSSWVAIGWIFTFRMNRNRLGG